MEPIFAVIQTKVSQLKRRREQNHKARHVEIKFIGFHQSKLSFAVLFMGLAMSFVFFIIEFCSTQRGQTVISGHEHSGYDWCMVAGIGDSQGDGDPTYDGDPTMEDSQRKETIPERKETIPRGRRFPVDSREEGDSQEEGDDSQGDRDSRAEGNAQGFPKGMPGGKRFPDEGDSQRGDPQRKGIPKGKGCPEEEDALGTRMPGGRDCPEDEDTHRTKMPGGSGRPEDVYAERRRSPKDRFGTPGRGVDPDSTLKGGADAGRRHTSASPRTLWKSRWTWKPDQYEIFGSGDVV